MTAGAHRCHCAACGHELLAVVIRPGRREQHRTRGPSFAWDRNDASGRLGAAITARGHNKNGNLTMSFIMLGDMSASSVGMPLADFVYLQRRGEDRVVRYRNRRRPRSATPGETRS